MAGDLKHPTRAMLERFLRAELPAAATQAVVAHLARGCERCRRLLAARTAGLFRPGLKAAPGAGREYGHAIDAALRRALAATGGSGGNRGLRPGRTAKPGLAAALQWYDRFLEGSRQARHTDLEQMVFFARGAVLTAQEFREEDFLPGAAADLKGRAWAELANAHRVTEDFAEADACFARAFACLFKGTGDLALLAHALDLLASLDRAARRFRLAFDRLDRVYSLYRELGDFHLAGRALINKGIAKAAANEPEEARALLRSGLNWLEPGRDPRLELIAAHNLIDFTVKAGRFAEARALIAEHQDLYVAHADPLHLLRLRWVEGQIAAGLGEAAHAEAAFERAREAFAERGLGYLAALVALDLAALWLTEGRTREVAELAGEMVATFRRLGIRREATAALLLFERAARKEQADLDLVRRIAARLQAIERAPAS